MVEVSQHLTFNYDRLRKVSGWMSDEASLQIWLSECQIYFSHL